MKRIGVSGFTSFAIILLAYTAVSYSADLATRQRIFELVKKTVERDYYDEALGGVPWGDAAKKAEVEIAAASDEASFYAAINRMLALLQDAHTGVASPTSVRNRKSPSRLALGFDARYLDAKLAVTGVRPGSAAADFGLERGWLVRSVQGAAVPGTQELFTNWMRELDLAALCQGDGVSIAFEDLTGTAKNFKGACTALQKDNRLEARREGNAVVVAFDRFDAASAKWFEEVIDSNLDTPLLVLDLRENTGGAKSALLQIASRLWPSKQLLGRSISRRGQKQDWAAGGVRPFRGRLTVLVDSNTQSAAEILSAALQESGRAKVLGRKTAGSVLVMISKPLPDGGQLRLSIEDFVTAKGRRLEGNAVLPDESLPLGLSELRSKQDPDLARALATN
jgi:carboxyl-terminal processing protease